MSGAKEKMQTGELYYPGDGEILEEMFERLEKVYEYNGLHPKDFERRASLLKEMFAEVGECTYIDAPFHANFGGGHVHLGSHVYSNTNLTLVDDSDIYIGDYTMIGPNVTLATAGHPVCPELREKGLQFNMQIHIGRNCWLGAGVIVVPGVTIGDNTVIGAGSVVTRDIPPNVVAVGNPCRVLREISERDREYYYKNCRIEYDEKGEVII